MTSTQVLATHEWPPAGTDAGAATPVAVLVHGITGWWRTWWRVGPALAERGWRVIAVDQRGHGTSPRIDGRVTAAELAEDLGSVIDRIGAPVDAVIGHSLGAAVAIELAYRRPEVARRLLLEDPPAVTRVEDVDFIGNLEREVIAARADPASEIARELAENPTWLERDARQDVEGKALADLEGILASLRQDTGVRVLDLAPLVRLPTLYVLAAADRSALPADPRERLLASLPPEARAIELDSGHGVHRDRFDDYLRILLDWVAG